MQTTTARAIYAYWSRVRAGRDIPNRRDIEPADLRQHLPDLFILEQSAGAGPSFRLAGTRLCSLFGRELRSAGLQRLFAPDVRERVLRICASSMAQRTPALLHASAYGGSDRAAGIEILLLPISSHAAHADRLFGVLCPIEAVQPLDLPLRYMTVDSVGMIDHEQENAFLQARPPIPLPASVMAVRKTDFGKMVRRVLHLRVFDGDK